MDAKMSNGEQRLRDQVAESERLEPALGRGPDVCLYPSEAAEVVEELDRLREFLRNAREAGENAIPENVQDDLRLAIEKHDRARATGGDGT